MRSPSGLHLRNDPNMFGRLPDPPEPIECDGKFDREKCVCCMGYDECLKESEEEEDTDYPGMPYQFDNMTGSMNL